MTAFPTFPANTELTASQMADLLAAVQESYGCPAAPITTSTNGTAVPVGTTETPDSVLGVYTFTAVANVRYRVAMTGRALSMTVAGDRYSVKLRYTNDGSTPTAASSLIDHDETISNPATGTAGASTRDIIVTFMPGAGTIKVISTWQRVAGTGGATPVGACSMWAEAIGRI